MIRAALPVRRFIRLSDSVDKSMIYLNSDHVVAVYKKKTDTVVCTTGARRWTAAD